MDAAAPVPDVAERSASRSPACTSTCATASWSRSAPRDGPRGVPAPVRPGRRGRQVAAVGDHPAARRALHRRRDRRLAAPRGRLAARARRSTRCARTAAPRSSAARRSPGTDAGDAATYLLILAACLIGDAAARGRAARRASTRSGAGCVATLRAGGRRVRRRGTCYAIRAGCGTTTARYLVGVDAARPAAAGGTAVLRRHPDLRGADLRGGARPPADWMIGDEP